MLANNRAVCSIGRGASGDVYLAESRSRQHYAIKKIKFRLLRAQKDLRSAQSEVKLMKQMRHVISSSPEIDVLSQQMLTTTRSTSCG